MGEIKELLKEVLKVIKGDKYYEQVIVFSNENFLLSLFLEYYKLYFNIFFWFEKKKNININ